LAEGLRGISPFSPMGRRLARRATPEGEDEGIFRNFQAQWRSGEI